MQWNLDRPQFNEPIVFVGDDPTKHVDQLTTIRDLCERLLARSDRYGHDYVQNVTLLIATLESRTAFTLNGEQFHIDHVAAHVLGLTEENEQHLKALLTGDLYILTERQCQLPCCRAQ